MIQKIQKYNFFYISTSYRMDGIHGVKKVTFRATIAFAMFYIALEEFWPNSLSGIILNLATLEGFQS